VSGRRRINECPYQALEQEHRLLHCQGLAFDLISEPEDAVDDGPHDGSRFGLPISGVQDETRPTPKYALSKLGLDIGQFRTTPSGSVDESPQYPSVGGIQSEELSSGEGGQLETRHAFRGCVDGAVEGSETVENQRSVEVIQVGEVFVDPLATDPGLGRHGSHRETPETLPADDGSSRLEQLTPSLAGPQIGPGFGGPWRHAARLGRYLLSVNFLLPWPAADAATDRGTAMAEVDPRGVDFHFDIMCPYAYQTSIWMREVRDLTGVEVRWRFFSLEEINRAENKKHPWERDWSYGWSMMRIGAYLRRTHMDLLDQWYWAAGTALHVQGRKPHRPEVAMELLQELGLDPAILRQALDDPTTGDEVRREHDIVVDKGAFGVPTLVFDDGQALFGPVLISPPRGDAAIRLWKLVTGWLEFPTVYELQRPKQVGDIASISAAFAPYLAARDWQSVQKPTP